jgi:hypothetical protein
LGQGSKQLFMVRYSADKQQQQQQQQQHVSLQLSNCKGGTHCQHVKSALQTYTLRSTHMPEHPTC